jgi:hypothetical protein
MSSFLLATLAAIPLLAQDPREIVREVQRRQQSKSQRTVSTGAPPPTSRGFAAAWAIFWDSNRRNSYGPVAVRYSF